MKKLEWLVFWLGLSSTVSGHVSPTHPLTSGNVPPPPYREFDIGPLSPKPSSSLHRRDAPPATAAGDPPQPYYYPTPEDLEMYVSPL